MDANDGGNRADLGGIGMQSLLEPFQCWSVRRRSADAQSAALREFKGINGITAEALGALIRCRSVESIKLFSIESSENPKIYKRRVSFLVYSMKPNSFRVKIPIY
ncbi:MAG: hypothetical protein OEN23_17360 [Paracoccaceae bacterium]|nr:hypothetical protein [Paracoccaceae bacterium]